MPKPSPTSAVVAYISKLKGICRILGIADSDPHYDVLINAYSKLAVSVEECEDFLLAYADFLPESLGEVLADTTRGGEDLLDLLLAYFDKRVGSRGCGDDRTSMRGKDSPGGTTSALSGIHDSMNSIDEANTWDHNHLPVKTGRASMQSDALEFLLTSAICALVRRSFTLLYNQTLGTNLRGGKSPVTTSKLHWMPSREPLPSPIAQLQSTNLSPQASPSTQPNTSRPKAAYMKLAFRHPQTRKVVFHFLQEIKNTPSLNLATLNETPPKPTSSSTSPLKPSIPPIQPSAVAKLSYKNFQTLQNRFWNSIIDPIETEITAMASGPSGTSTERHARNMSLSEMRKRLENVCEARRELAAEFA